MIPWLSAGQPFPGVDTALKAPNGLLAASSELTVEQLVAAYRQGIFPWYAEGEPVLWWSPDPRMVLYCDEFRVARSLGKSLRRAAADPATEVTIDRDFAGVMQACAAPRSAEVGTWITQEVKDAYSALHRRGLAHSVETWVDGRLVGGLYGVSIGRMFFGESMFARAADASKIALTLLVRILQSEGVPVIDCQQNTRHLASLGGREIARDTFCAHVASVVTLAPVAWAKYKRARLNPLLAPSALAAD
jgi:leucyl/phenylalanyl-tRNA---protein transferase